MTDVIRGNMQFKEAIAYIKQKLDVTTERWNDLAGPAHAKAFTVAGATKIGLVKDLHAAIQKSIDTGGTITQFRKDFDSIVAKHGWSYKGKRGWRTSVIFRVNKSTAKLAGRWAQAWRMREYRPYMQYLTVGDERVRDSHRIHDLKVYPITHPFWKTHYPPNGWLCRCRVRTLDDTDIENEGLQVSGGNAPEPYKYTDPATGEIIDAYKGIDVGWDHNVGLSWQAPEVLLGQEIMKLPSPLRAKALKNIATENYDKPLKALVDDVALAISTKKPSNFGRGQTVGFIPETVNTHLSKKGLILVGSTLIATDKNIYHWLRQSKADSAKAIPLSVARDLPKLLRKPTAILFDKSDQSLLYAFKLGNGRYAKFIVHLNFKGKLTQFEQRFNDYLNVFKSASLTYANNLIGPDLELVQGEID